MLDWSDGKMSEIFFFISLGCTLLAMVSSPLEWDSWSIAAASVAVVTALGGIYLAFHAWEEPLPEDVPDKPDSSPQP
ncbi:MULTISPECIES: hypothetical protein [Caproicibacterium]|uniref:Uncharacterized protein n=1 Tax=Caproicibacterium lactatifermentans TaxID=2666138 RepID=A0A859DN79_9FIRM|nr:hypothetical protein [Caproicibacterium lactatifermentans]ARP50995.1 hypothetical protein B6259_09000 [Ruminococcaceae bacterium CPB6]MDD4807098.1 hypothetical protein [Oscillospiraceae bacterium]QKN23278.1 hypothetical protein GJQ69_01500 [Caproicibacterium lactatifermentans]QKO30040.1 hypothetical protein GKP14_02850 [Caproicibacterium lactatifermentans]